MDEQYVVVESRVDWEERKRKEDDAKLDAHFTLIKWGATLLSLIGLWLISKEKDNTIIFGTVFLSIIAFLFWFKDIRSHRNRQKISQTSPQTREYEKNTPLTQNNHTYQKRRRTNTRHHPKKDMPEDLADATLDRFCYLLCSSITDSTENLINYLPQKIIMTKKGSVNLTLNSIVVIIFAITMLGLGLAFINGAFTNVTEKVTFPEPDIDATADTPIILPFETLTVEKGRQAEFSINFYNNENGTVTASPVITACLPGSFGNTTELLASVGQSVAVGKTATYKSLFTIPADAPSQKYTCNLQLSQTSKQFFLEVK